MPAPLYFTAEMVRALPEDGNRYETVHGELLVTPAPRPWHQELVSRLHVALVGYLRQHPVGHLIASPADISWGEDILVQPDLFVVPLEQARALRWSAMRDLLLAVEVVSPSSARADRFTKRRLYKERGVGCYWVVDGELESVEIWLPGDRAPRAARERAEWRAEEAAEAFGMDLGVVPGDLRRPALQRRPAMKEIARIALGGCLIFAGIGHLTFARKAFRAQVPDWVPLEKDSTVVSSGIAEIALGSALALAGEAHRQMAGKVAAAFFVAVFPGNLSQWANRRSAFGLDTDAKRFARLFFQPALIYWALKSTHPSRP